MPLSTLLSTLWPRPMPMAARRGERLRAGAGAGLGIAITGWLSLWLAQTLGLSPWLVAPLGASAVLVFAVPASPLAQPWPVVGGNTVSAVAGVLCSLFIPDPVLAGAVAVGSAIALMFFTRSLHPPGGAMALLVVLSHVKSPLFPLFPALVNSLLLVAAGIVWHSLTRHAYPHVVERAGDPMFTDEDFSAALAAEPELIDIDRRDLRRLCEAAVLNARRREA
ncbi:MAG: HPP family protein [Asticcacaulis sp.]